MNWRLTHHCLRRCQEYGITTDRVMDVVLNWDQEYGSSPNHPAHYRVRQAKDLAVVVDPNSRAVITVLQRRQEAWGRQAPSPG